MTNITPEQRAEAGRLANYYADVWEPEAAKTTAFLRSIAEMLEAEPVAWISKRSLAKLAKLALEGLDTGSYRFVEEVRHAASKLHEIPLYEAPRTDAPVPTYENPVAQERARGNDALDRYLRSTPGDPDYAELEAMFAPPPAPLPAAQQTARIAELEAQIAARDAVLQEAESELLYSAGNNKDLIASIKAILKEKTNDHN